MSPSAPKVPAVVLSAMETQIAEKQKDLDTTNERWERAKVVHLEKVAGLESDLLELRVALCQLTQGISRKEALQRFKTTTRRITLSVDTILEWAAEQPGPFALTEMLRALGANPGTRPAALREILDAGLFKVVQEGRPPGPEGAPVPWIFEFVKEA